MQGNCAEALAGGGTSLEAQVGGASWWWRECWCTTFGVQSKFRMRHHPVAPPPGGGSQSCFAPTLFLRHQLPQSCFAPQTLSINTKPCHQLVPPPTCDTGFCHQHFHYLGGLGRAWWCRGVGGLRGWRGRGAPTTAAAGAGCGRTVRVCGLKMSADTGAHMRRHLGTFEGDRAPGRRDNPQYLRSIGPLPRFWSGFGPRTPA